MTEETKKQEDYYDKKLKVMQEKTVFTIIEREHLRKIDDRIKQINKEIEKLQKEKRQINSYRRNFRAKTFQEHLLLDNTQMKNIQKKNKTPMKNEDNKKD